jgi:hypothetical protein
MRFNSSISAFENVSRSTKHDSNGAKFPPNTRSTNDRLASCTQSSSRTFGRYRYSLPFLVNANAPFFTSRVIKVCTVGGFQACVFITASITSPEVASPRAQNACITTHSASEIEGVEAGATAVDSDADDIFKMDLQV